VLNKKHILSVQTVTDTDHVATPPKQTISKAELDKFPQSYGLKVSPSLAGEKHYQILELFYRYKSVFARDVSNIKACKGPPLKLDVHTNRKTFQRQYRLSDTEKAEVTRQINQTLEAGVIEPSDTPYYNSPICLIAKKSGEKRLVVDLRAILETHHPGYHA